jgi:hypothetical protein
VQVDRLFIRDYLSDLIYRKYPPFSISSAKPGSHSEMSAKTTSRGSFFFPTGVLIGSFARVNFGDCIEVYVFYVLYAFYEEGQGSESGVELGGLALGKVPEVSILQRP